MEIKTFPELEAAISELLPDALFSEGRNGEIIIETGLKYVAETDIEELEKI